MDAITSARPTTNSEPTAAEPTPIVSRIDGPHALIEPPLSAADIEAVAQEALAEVTLAAVTGRSHDHLTEQLHAQALQLGDLLRQKQTELDRREALLNAREAKVENELRIARLWSRERDEEERQQERDYAQRRITLETDAARVAAAEISLERDLATQQVQLALRAQALEQQALILAQQEESQRGERAAIEIARERLEQERVEQATARLAEEQRLIAWRCAAEESLAGQVRNIEVARAALEERQADLARQAAEVLGSREREAWEARLSLRERDLTAAEKLLAAHARELDEERSALAAEKQRLESTARDERQDLAAWQKQERAQLAERKRQVELAEEALDRHRGAVEQLRDDAARMHREALELRLVAEQIWQELARHVPAVELTRSLATLRGRLAEHYREAGEQLAAQRRELVELATRLEERQTKLVEQREQLRTWLASRESELESRIAQLGAREQALQSQEELAGSREVAWREERRALRRQLRDALARLRRAA